ncbi:MAG: 16S rRNA (guanine(527)-N(7))-methyltransferase RsmG [Proteobacteria bacterium]|nr:16S rRNA (guanine(527)-N(7))-methyltransferase RsmG [Pseudomonadota bacterium]
MTQHPEAAAWQARLVAGARQLGLEMQPRQAEQCWQLAGLLRERNQHVNLTAVDTLDGILTVHILDSLAIVPHLGAAHRVIDIGTGGGFPGLPLAIACPERDFLLIDGTQKKIRFVQEAIDALRLGNARAEAVRAEQLSLPSQTDVPRVEMARFDVAIVRAVGPLRSLVAVATKLLEPTTGRILAMKGKRPDAELADLPRGWMAELVPLAVPDLAAERHLVILTRREPPQRVRR